MIDLPDIPPVLLPVSKLFVDYTYHQPPRRSAVNAIARSMDPSLDGGFDPVLFGDLLVTQRNNGRYSIVDGATRYCGLKEARRRGFPVPVAVFCIVLTLSDRRAEAEFFCRLNGNNIRYARARRR